MSTCGVCGAEEGRAIGIVTEEDGSRHPCVACAKRGSPTLAFGVERETVDHPRHYNMHPSGVEAIVIVEHMTFNVGNAVKYAWRAGLKSPDPVEDLRKAAWYIAREIERLTKGGK